jgi:hypothetical protein
MSVMKWIRNQWDRVTAVGLMAAAALAMLAGWFGVSRSAYPAESMPYIVSGGFFGLLLIGIGAVLWLSADLRDEWRKLDGIEQAWRDATIGRPAETPAATRTVQGGEAARATTAAR